MKSLAPCQQKSVQQILSQTGSRKKDFSAVCFEPLAAGAEAFENCAHPSQAIAVSVEATTLLMDSFEEHEDRTRCREIIKYDFDNKLSFIKYMLSGWFLYGFQLAKDRAAKSVRKAEKVLSDKTHDFELSLSCTTKTARNVGASEKKG